MSEFRGPLFLVGMPRSGTKLLRDLLNRNPRVGIPEAETEFLPYLAHRISKYDDLSDKGRFADFYAYMETLSYFHWRRRAGRQLGCEDWYSNCRKFDAAGVFEALLRADAGCPYDSNRIWGDKSPSYIDDIGLLDQLYPACRVVHIVRDVRDYCVSIRRAWGKNALRAAQRWADGVAAARLAGAGLGTRFLQVRYEDLLANPERELRRICTFIDIEFMPVMLTLDRPSESRGNARGEARIVQNNAAQYMNEISPELLWRIEEVAGHEMKTHGYDLATAANPGQRLSRPHMTILQVMDAVNLLRHGRSENSILSGIWYHMKYFFTTRG